MDATDLRVSNRHLRDFAKKRHDTFATWHMAGNGRDMDEFGCGRCNKWDKFWRELAYRELPKPFVDVFCIVELA